MVLQLDTVRWSWWHCAAPAWVSYRRSSDSCTEIARILIQISLRPVVARSHRSHAGVALAWAPSGALIWDCSGARTLNARSQGLCHRVVLVRFCLPGHQSDGESSNFVREIHLFLDPGSLWAAQVLSSPATVMKAFQIDALIARVAPALRRPGTHAGRQKTLAISMILCGTTKACGPHTFTFAQALIEACGCFCCNGMQGGWCLRWLCYQFYAKYFCRSVTMQSCWHCAGLKVFEFHGDVSWFKEIFGPRASVRHIL